MPLKNASLAANVVFFIVIIGLPIGILLTILGIDIPVFFYVVWGFAFFIVFVSVLLENMPKRHKNNDA